jgi:hypothetical protein
MGRLLFAFVLASAAALGEQPRTDIPKLDPYPCQGARNALRPLESFSKNQQSFRQMTVPPSTAQSLLPKTPGKPVARCAIPLTRFPAGANIDRGIQHKLNLEGRKVDRMPVANTVPACPEDHPLPR